MDDPQKDFLTSYRSFFEYLLRSVDLDYPLPVKIANYNLTEYEIAGEITTWCLQYLIERECPPSLATILCKRVLEEVSRVDPELCGYRPQEQVYYPLQLMQETIRKLVEVCRIYTDNARLSDLPPPPSSILYDPIVSMCGVKNSRRTMEDRHIAIQDLHTLFNVKNAVGPASYYAVFDGHNGFDAATYANCHLHHYLVQSKHYPHNPEAALREAFAITDKRFIEKTAKGNLESGTTAVCALIRPEESMLYLAWLGDSQAVLATRGVAYQLVKPHRPDQPEERQRIKNMGGAVLFLGTWRVDGNLAVSRAIGDKLYKPYIVSEPDIRVVPLTGKEDYLILASDGLWDFLSEQDAVQAVDAYLAEKKGEVGGVSKHLIQLAKKQCSRDNISCIIVFLRDPSELIIDNKANMEVQQELDQPTSVVDQLWMRHQQAAVDTHEPTPILIPGKHNGRMDEDDLGPETDVDSVDDVLLSPTIAAAKAVQANSTPVCPREKLQKEQQMWLKTLPWSYADAVRKSPPKKQLIQEEIKTELPLLNAEPSKLDIQPLPSEDEIILKDPAVIAKGEEIKNYVGDNDIDSGEESEEEWNYIPGKEDPKENKDQIQQIKKELNAEEDEEDMESQLNPNAAEFVPVFIPRSLASNLEKDISSSPAKGAEQSLENIQVPTDNEFFSEISKRPAELESLSNEPNETTLNGINITGVSTRAIFGGDDSINFLSSVNNSQANLMDDDEVVPLNDTNPFSPTHVPEEVNKEQTTDTIQDKMVQDHFSLGFKPFDPMTQSVTMMEDEGQVEGETSPDIDFMSSDKPDLLSPETNQAPVGGTEAHDNLEAQTSSSGFDSESGPDDGDHIPVEQCNLSNAAATVGISFGEDINIENLVNTKSSSLIDDSHPIEKIEQTISPSVSPLPPQAQDSEIKEKLVSESTEVLTEIIEEHATIESPVNDSKSEEAHPPASVDVLVENSTSSLPEDKPVEEEILVKGMSPSQMFDLVQKLQFNQDIPAQPHKENEPESDSGFEIINASEAQNEPDLIEGDSFNKMQHKDEEPSLINGLDSNCVPDLLMKPSEPEIERQQSPVGTGSENIIADIEGAMLDSSPPRTSNTTVDDSINDIEKSQEIIQVPLSTDDQKTDGVLERTKSPFLFEEVVTGFDVKKSPEPSGDITVEKELVMVDEKVEEIKEVATNEMDQENKDSKEVVENITSSYVEEMSIEPRKVDDVLDKIHEDESKSIVISEEPSAAEELLVKEIKDHPIIESKELASPVDNEVNEQKTDIIKEETLVLKEETSHEESKNEIIEQPHIIEKSLKEDIKEEKEVCEVEEVIKEPETVIADEPKKPVDEEKPNIEEVLPTQPTPPTTPAPGVTESNQQELLAAAIAAAGVAATAGAVTAAVSVPETPKVEAKPASPVKNSTVSTTAAKKPEPSKPAAKSPSKPATSVSSPAAKKTATPTTATKTASKPAPSSKPSTPTTRSAPSTKAPLSKPGTPTTKTALTSVSTKTPPKPKTTVTAKPPTTAATTTAAPKTNVGTASKTTTATARPSSATAPKRPELTTAKKPAASTTTALKTSLAAKTAATKTTASAPKPTAAKPASSVTATKAAPSKPLASKTSAPAAKAPVKTIGSSSASAKTSTTTARSVPSKTAPAKAPSTNSTAAKAPITKTKPAAPTAIKKPMSADKNIKDATNNKLSTSKQPLKPAGAIKKQEVKTKDSDTKIIEPLTQEPTVTTTNGHIENGISNEEASPVEIAQFPQIVESLN